MCLHSETKISFGKEVAGFSPASGIQRYPAGSNAVAVGRKVISSFSLNE
jgi:hypothetical protein